MDKIQGSQFYAYLTGNNMDYDLCSQIVLVVYDGSTEQIVWRFVKQTDPVQYPDAYIIEKSEDPDYKLKIFITEAMTLALQPGTYKMEAKRVIAGIKQPVMKSRSVFLTITKTLTD